MTITQRILGAIHTHPDGATLAQLARVTRITIPTLQLVLKVLRRDDLVARDYQPARGTCYKVTPDGARLTYYGRAPRRPTGDRESPTGTK